MIVKVITCLKISIATQYLPTAELRFKSAVRIPNLLRYSGLLRPEMVFARIMKMMAIKPIMISAMNTNDVTELT